jgi:hypothetical protein
LLGKVTKLLGRASTLLITLLAKGAILLRSPHALLVTLLPKISKLLRIILNCCAISLSRAQANALLLLRCRKGLLIILLVKRSNCLRLSKGLLPLQGRPLQASALAAKSATTDCVRLLLRQLLPLLLIHGGLRGVHYALGVRVHVTVNI